MPETGQNWLRGWPNMEFSHVPVLYREVLENLAVKKGGIYVD